ncbi:DUF1311 domain-containing protein [Sphingomonas psychrotolerans]|uniref:DUF1311 domain-containing protein n=1 Tax=Sphingomonas psychrotolerans TaxID=1327635 RepID=A0ABU3N9E6_9SPHN|nr:DUF1311 domain-containing protein [Sphingomonas psychrotolerans]
MRRVAGVILVVAAICWSGACSDQTVVRSAEEFDRTKERCDGLAPQVRVLGCFVDAAKTSRLEVDRTLNRALQAAAALENPYNAFARSRSLPNADLVRDLKAAQTAWLSYSMSQCALEGGVAFGGSGTDILEAQCRYRLNVIRLSELRAAIRLLED